MPEQVGRILRNPWQAIGLKLGLNDNGRNVDTLRSFSKGIFFLQRTRGKVSRAMSRYNLHSELKGRKERIVRNVGILCAGFL